ncbi:hypothetical protein M9Y10_029545 [Tritrichomonas musculus]|uniref:Uncharacterized protein n=1 Tax=Tritrichomonas musculus TaxID=1915356 RepID=A0ABR2KMF6_9EUKA
MPAGPGAADIFSDDGHHCRVRGNDAAGCHSGFINSQKNLYGRNRKVLHILWRIQCRCVRL